MGLGRVLFVCLLGLACFGGFCLVLVILMEETRMELNIFFLLFFHSVH